MKKFFLLALLMLVIFVSMNLAREKQKVLLIGLDGASWKIINPLIKEGKLPNIKSLMDNGCWGKLATIKPLKSEVIWTSIATGKPPYLHDIIDALITDPDTGEQIPPTTNLRKVKAVWNILSEHGKKVGVVGYKVSWPAEKVNGVMVSDRLESDKPYLLKGYSEPPFKDLFNKNIYDSFYETDRDSAFQVTGDSTLLRDLFLSNCAEYLLKRQKFDFLCLYLCGIDWLSHDYWKYMFPEGEDVTSEDISKNKNVINAGYMWCDKIIGKLLKLIDKDTIVIIISDHSFTKRYMIANYYIFSRIDKLLEALGLKEFNYNSKKVALENIGDSLWSYKKNIRIVGELDENELQAVRDKIGGILNNIRVKETRDYIFRVPSYTTLGFILEISNRYINYNRDNHIILNNKEYKISDFLVKSPSSGDHDPYDAIIIMSGKNIRRKQTLKYASIYDILPVVLYLSGLPVANDMPGKVLRSAIVWPYLFMNPVRKIDTYEDSEIRLPQKPVRSPEDEEIIKDRMRSLGYIN